MVRKIPTRIPTYPSKTHKLKMPCLTQDYLREEPHIQSCQKQNILLSHTVLFPARMSPCFSSTPKVYQKWKFHENRHCVSHSSLCIHLSKCLLNDSLDFHAPYSLYYIFFYLKLHFIHICIILIILQDFFIYFPIIINFIALGFTFPLPFCNACFSGIWSPSIIGWLFMLSLAFSKLIS